MTEELRARYLAAKHALFDTVMKDSLNECQREAVYTTEGPLLVLAGAGSGKTTVLVKRIAFMIKYGNAYFDDNVPEGTDEQRIKELELAATLNPSEIESDILPEFICNPCPPWAVLAITFTNKAAKEIAQRLSSAFDDETIVSQIWTGTFHSVCLKILRTYTVQAGYKAGFTIYDTDDKRTLLTSIMKELRIDEKQLSVKGVMSQISHEKDNLRLPDDMAEGENSLAQNIRRIYSMYQKRLVEYNVMDFDDIIMQTVRLLENCKEARLHCQRKFKYVSVDEYQDTNPAQFRLTQLLCGGYNNIMVVGDDDQSIYRFRGATVENILRFDRVFDNCKVIKLEQNYRSTEYILDAANAVISHNTTRHRKNLWSARGKGEKISIHACTDQWDEGRFITNTIMSDVIRRKRRYRDFAVLYRINELSRSLEGAFIKSGIPYRVLGGLRFYDRKEIKDIVSYLCVILNTGDTGRLKRIINEPKRKIGDAAVDAASLIADAQGRTLFDVMENAADYTALLKFADKFTAFAKLIRSFQSFEGKPSELIEKVFEETGYHQMLVEGGDAEKVRVDQVMEFVSAAVEYESRCEQPTLPGFLEEVLLVSDTDKYDEDADAVVLMTIHSAKGLEFPCVFLPGMEEGIFPGTQSQTNPSGLDEERRLCYVAITRAKEKIFITYAAQRLLYGHTVYQLLSRFVKSEIPHELTDESVDVENFEPPHTVYGFDRQNTQPRKPNYTDYRKQTGTRTAPSSKKPKTSENTYVSPYAAAVKPTSSAQKGFGVQKLSPGTKVIHDAFGHGTILSAKDMAGDMLYEIEFDDGTTKKLMATYARLKIDE